MFPKLAALILALGIIGTSLLALRQQRLQAASEAAQAQLRIQKLDEELLTLRAQVASAVTPSAVEKLVASVHTTDGSPLRPATNDVPLTLATNELKGLPPDLGGIPPIEPSDDEEIIIPPPAKAKQSPTSSKPTNTKPATKSTTKDGTKTSSSGSKPKPKSSQPL
ncbi:MAG: hypothetical protein U0640_07020 [Phycisphaerales bacterium]